MIYDISPLVDEAIAVWPGDSPYEARDLLRIEDGAGVHLSTIRLSCHTGAHADAPGHYLEGGPGIDAVPLEPYLGPCRLVEIPPGIKEITPAALEGLECPGLPAAEGIDLQKTSRILIRTGCQTDRSVFPRSLTALTVALIEYLAAAGVCLIGLDSPSVDRFDSKDLPCHKALFRHGIANLESLALAGVPTGRYELIALPLRLRGRDASPVRAILRTLSDRPR